MSPFRKKLPALSFAALLSAAGGCAPAEDEGQMLDVTCEGKCDGIGSVRSLLADARKLDLNDLLSIGARDLWRRVSSTLNASIGNVSFASVQLATPKAYASSADAANDLTLGNIDTLVSGLASQYGERELTTQINRLRQAELASRPGSVFAEAAFRLDTGLNAGFTLGTSGFENARTNIGFTAGRQNEMRIITRVDRERDAYLREPLKAMQASHGFVQPTSVDDVRKLQPGEIIARSGAGVVGLNLGTQVPLLVASPVQGVGYGLLFNAALRTTITADRMDVQIARMGGNEVVVDVGVSDGRNVTWRVAVEDGWGALGVPGGNQMLGKVALELGKLAEKSLGRALDARKQLFSASVSNTTAKARVSVSRLRFDLGALDDAGQEAFAQALHGDLRLAQAMAWKGAPGVKADFDLFRSGTSATSYAGVDILGMRFFGEKAAAQGEVVLDGPGGARALLFDTLHRASGWFFTSHGFNRVGLGGLSYDDGGSARTETNLFVQVEHGDKYLERDALLDHLDAVLQEVGGRAALASIEDAGNQIERYVQSTCPSDNAFSSCYKTILSDPTVVGLRASATAALEAATQSLGTDARALAQRIGELRLAASAAHEYAAQFVGPSGSVVYDYRVDDASLASLLSDGGAARLNEALYSYLEATNVDRESGKSLADQRSKIRSDKRSKVEALGQILSSVAQDYQRYVAVEGASIDTVGKIGARVLEIRFGLDGSGRADYDSALARSFAEARMNVATGLFDKLRDAASGLGPYSEQVVAHGLMGAMPADHRDLRLDVKFNLKSESDGTEGHYVTAGYGDLDGDMHGAKAAAVTGGLFSIDALLKTE